MKLRIQTRRFPPLDDAACYPSLIPEPPKSMNEILTQLIAAAIDADKIPGLDCFDMTRRPRGQFEIVLNDTTRIRITVEDVSDSEDNINVPL
jgi:hypothetical protein